MTAKFWLSKGLAKTGELSKNKKTKTIIDAGFITEYEYSLQLEKILGAASLKNDFIIDETWAAGHLPERKEKSNKSDHGHLLVLAGREGFWGSGVLCALSAYRMGAGYVTWAGSDLENLKQEHLKSVPEALTARLDDPDLFSGKTAAAAGPGLGVNEKVKDLILKLKKTKLAVVLDADAVTVCAKNHLFPLPSHWIITPHSGELGRLFQLSGKEIDQDRKAYVLRAEEKTHCAVLLKGFRSLIAYQKKCYGIEAGNASLAKAGTGDVLTGLIGALLARGLDAFSAGALGAFIHGRIADEWLKSGKDQDTLLASDLIKLLPPTLHQLRRSASAAAPRTSGF